MEYDSQKVDMLLEEMSKSAESVKVLPNLQERNSMSDLSKYEYQPVKSTMNQLANTKNHYQGDATKALCVCSAGLLRSPSIAKFLTEQGYNTRACGTNQEYALVPLSVALLTWADEIHVVAEQASIIFDQKEKLKLNAKVYVYDIPDMYRTFEPELIEIIKQEFEKF